MKKLAIFFMSGAALVFSSCSELEQTSQEQGSIAAVMEGTGTRTSVTDEGTFTWSEGDKIWLQTTNGSIVGTLSDGEGTANANFSYGTIIGGTLTGKAIYPYNAGHSVSDDAVAVVLPASYELGSALQNTNAAMYGVASNGTIKFNHLAGVMRFSFKDVPAGVDRFAITLDKKINGTFEANLAADYPVLETIATDVEAEKTVELNFDALAQTSDINLYVPLPLGTYTTLALKFFKGDTSVWTYFNTVTNTVNRRSLKLMPVVTIGGSIGGEIEGDDTPSEPKEGDYVDEYGINHGQGIEIDGVVWAPVNCGYHKTDFKYGKLYQWGRKYGQGYSLEYDATEPDIHNGATNLNSGQSESNSNIFYSSNNDYYNDWISSQDSYLWNIGSYYTPAKSEYDPCPAGWRIASQNEMDNLRLASHSWVSDSNGLSGYVYTGTDGTSQMFLPLAGYRGVGGSPYGRNKYGYYWSADASNSFYSSYLIVSESDIQWYSNKYRATGCSVRCVKEASTPETPETPETPPTVDLSEGGNANSYIVSKFGSYKFTPTKGNSSESVGTIASVEILWESFGTNVTPNVGDMVKNVKYENGSISFETPSAFKEGNAVIAAKDASGTILWSWHIWLTDEPQGQEYYNNAGTMMDRNLGATSATPGDVGALGLLYQWGRKDPFLGSSSISESLEAASTITWPSPVSSNSSNGTIEYAFSHPTTFISCNENNGDWFYQPSGTTFDMTVSNSRWSRSSKDKSIYDPCPAGWRIPDGGEKGVWANALCSVEYFTDESLYNIANVGMDFSNKFGESSSIWYPDTGYRSYDSGKVARTYCYYWSASTINLYACTLFFNNVGRVGVLPGCSRSHGYPVRCIQE